MVRCFTYYSYKGGSGRSTTLLNSVKYLAQELGADSQHPILLVDADLESAGLTYFFGYTNKFKGDVNTCSILHSFTSIVTMEETKVIFGNYDESKRLVRCSDTEVYPLLKKLDEEDTVVGAKISEIFKDLQLPGKYFVLLKKIVNAYLKKETSYDSPGTKTLWGLKEDLKKINNMSVEEDEKVKLKCDAVIDFLPARTFMDVTDYFSKDDSLEPGTVKFLGTDVSNESRVSRADAQSGICSLFEKCEEYGYSAILFDSGAGTQSSAYVLHGLSDVIVYCMRPTMQFITGTFDNLFRFNQILRMESDKDKKKKKVIIFPNAVPDNYEGNLMGKFSFDKIKYIAKCYSDLIDDTFCDIDTCLHEVPLFKWRETVLGCYRPDKNSNNLELEETIEKLSNDEASNKKYTDVYKKLAKRLIENS